MIQLMTKHTDCYIETRDEIMRLCQEYQMETRCGNALVASMLMDIAHRIENNDKAIALQL